MQRDMLNQFEVGDFEILSEDKVTYKIHDKWGRPNVLILFD